MEKMTNKKALAYVLENCEMPADVRDKVEKIMASFDKKSSSRKMTDTQKENIVYKEQIMAYMVATDGWKTCANIRQGVPSLSGLMPQRVAPMLKGLHEEGKLIKKEEKGQTFFKIADDFDFDEKERTDE